MPDWLQTLFQGALDGDKRCLLFFIALYEFDVNGERVQGSGVSAWEIATNGNARFFLYMQLKRINRGPDDTVQVFYTRASPRNRFFFSLVQWDC